jgi:signal transduction histidine kinase
MQEKERRRIARDVHDELGQALTTLKFDLAWLAQHLPPKPASLQQKTATMLNDVDAILDTLRRIATTLWPRVLDDLGLLAAVEWQVREFQRHTDIATTLTISPEHVQMEPAVALTAFRFLQEALTNVVRHAQATHVAVRLHIFGSVLRLVVRDNGQGISQDALSRPDRLGLKGMRQRVMACGGDMRIRGRQGSGTVITARLPLALREDDPHGGGIG